MASTTVRIDPGNHVCDPPDPGEDASCALSKNGGSAVWTCPMCRSNWMGTGEFNRTYRGGKEWGYVTKWRRTTESGRRWKRAEQRRIEDLAAGHTKGVVV